MKFGKQLEVNCNPEWQQYYVQYKRLKRIIKRVVFEIESHKVKKEDSKTSLNVQSKKNLNEKLPLLHPMESQQEIMARKEFWEVIDLNIKQVNDFFSGMIMKLSKSVHDFEQINHESHGHVHTRPRSLSLDIERGFAGLQDVYDQIVDLRAYVQLNFSGFRKIVKKFDKTIKETNLESFLVRLKSESFYVSRDLDTLADRIFAITSKDKLEAGNIERRTKQQGNDNELLRKVKKIPFSISLVLFIILLCLPSLFSGDGREQRCLAMLVFVTSLWVTEAVPYFATAILIPPMVVFLNVLTNKTDPSILLTAKQSAKEVMSLLVNHTTILIMGGYAISAAFTKCQIELYIAAFLQQRFKKQPQLFLLAIMLMGLFLSMWISNHTAPVLCVSVLLPILRDFPSDSQYVKTLLIGLAFACNLGGMMTPIASLQNTLAVSYLEKAGYSISFGQWMTIAIPFCTISTILCWIFLLWVMNPSDATYIPQIVYDQKKKINRMHIVIVLFTLLTIALWATFSITSATFGDLGIISLLFMFCMFGSGMLSQFDFNSFSWHILFLIGGGNVLGDAVQRSGLLQVLSGSLVDALPTDSVWFATFLLCLLVLFLTTFVSHTVGSIILLPIIVQMSIQLGHPHIPVVSCALSISAAMALPFSSFPNINSLLVLDDHGKPYLQVSDFLRVGVIFSIITVCLIVTLGFGLIVGVLGYSKGIENV